MIAFDTETYLIQPGLVAPRLVCGSICGDGQPKLVMDREETLAWFRRWLATPEHLVGANIAYDMAVMCAADPELIEPVFKAYEAGRIHDVQIRQTLNAIAKGLIVATDNGTELIDERTGSACVDPAKGKITNRYSLAMVADILLGVKMAKLDTWRMRYALLDGTPVKEWPPEAVDYSGTDAEITYRCWAVQEGLAPVNPEVSKLWPDWKCENLHDEVRQVRAHWCMHLGGVWGIRTDKERVEALAAKVEATHAKAVEQFTGVGLIKPDGKQNKRAVKLALCTAYNVTGQCSACGGTGKVTSEKSGNPINCKDCDSTGLNLSSVPALPRTDGGGVSIARDTLRESGDELLEDFAEVSNNEKFRTTYVPFLRGGTDHPISLRPNPLVATGRTSYDGLIQLLPREGGIRDCFVARPGYVFCSVDYSTLELCTLAQVNLWLQGWSRMAEALQRGEELHSRLGARIAGIPFADFLARRKAKDKHIINLRQLAKPVNFGLPGGMSAPKLVFTARKDGETVCPDGFVHKGTRFCVLAGIAPRCSRVKTTKYVTKSGRERDIIPTCVDCLRLADEYRDLWMAEWEEMEGYFRWVSNMTEGEAGGRITQWVSQRVRGGLGYCDGANTGFQGLAADGAKWALWKLSKECHTDRTSPLYGSHPIIFVHDEVFAEIREDRAHEAAYRMAEVMVGAMKEWVPDVPINAVPAISRYWYKAMEAVTDSSGRLIPWEPAKKAA